MSSLNRRSGGHNRLKGLLARAVGHASTPLTLEIATIMQKEAVKTMEKIEEAHNNLLDSCTDLNAVEVQTTAFEPILTT